MQIDIINNNKIKYNTCILEADKTNKFNNNNNLSRENINNKETNINKLILKNKIYLK